MAHLKAVIMKAVQSSVNMYCNIGLGNTDIA